MRGAKYLSQNCTALTPGPSPAKRARGGATASYIAHRIVWRTGSVFALLLTLTACQGPLQPFQRDSVQNVSRLFHSRPTVQSAGFAEVVDCPLGPPGMENGVPLPYAPASPWSPPGIAQPWPLDEYVRDGGDANLPAAASTNHEVRGLEMEDTVAHFDTIDGRTLVEPSNRVHLYAPRFGAVRQVVGLVQAENRDISSGIGAPTQVVLREETQRTGASTQREQALRNTGNRQLVQYRQRQGERVYSASLLAHGFQDLYLPFENLAVLRTGQYVQNEMAILIKGAQAAQVWSIEQMVQVVLDNRAAAGVTRNQQAEVVYTVKQPPANPKLRLIKVASTQFAQPGETVDFTLRFDNVGNQPIGNVTLLDNLSSRLEYVPDSAQCSVPAEFFSRENETGSLVLRWEITQPLEPGQGGVIRFTCRVR